MLHKRRETRVTGRRTHAPVFAALGDRTRLSLVARLSSGQSQSISQLTKAGRISRQAITKHLRVLERVGVVRSRRRGRQSLFELNPKPLDQAREYLALVSEHWDRALSRLKAFVESNR